MAYCSAGKPKESTAGWHGLTAWALTTLVIFYLLTTTVGGLVGGAGNEGIGGGREKAGGLLELPAESVRGGGLFEVGECFCILRGPTVGVASPSLSYRRKSSSSGRPCLRPSIVLRDYG